MSTSLTVAAQGHTLADMQQMASAVAQSGLFPHLKQPNQALALMLLCHSKGLHPMEAVERYHVVQGRPVMRADAMLSEFIRGGGRVEWHERTDKIADATFSHPQGGSVRVAWTFEQAKAANLTGKEVWRQYPRQMLHARCVSEGVRSVLPGATNGLYTPEEAQDMAPIRAEVVAEPVLPQTPQEAREATDAARQIAEQAKINEAMALFGNAAKEAGFDVTDPKTGRFSRSAMIDCAKQWCDGEPRTADDWIAAALSLRDASGHGQEEAAAQAVAEVIDPELAAIADPFAKEESE